MGTPAASLNTPGSCWGGTSYPINGQASSTIPNDPEFHATLTVENAASAQVYVQKENTAQAPGGAYTAHIDTTGLPTGIALRVRLRVSDSDGGPVQDSVVLTPTFDRQAPISLDAPVIRAKSSRQLYVQHGRSFDLGCAGLDGYDVAADESIALMSHQYPSGKQLQGLTDPALAGGQTYLIQTRAVDKNGLVTPWSAATAVTTPSDYGTVLAGRTTREGKPLFGVKVSGDGRQAQSDAAGWYSLSLTFSSSTYSVTYGPGCGIPVLCGAPVTPITDSVTTPQAVGLVQIKHKAVD